MSDVSFVDWLKTQSGREDHIGELARVVGTARRRRGSSAGDVQRFIDRRRRGQAHAVCTGALTAAMTEYSARPAVTNA